LNSSLPELALTGANHALDHPVQLLVQAASLGGGPLHHAIFLFQLPARIRLMRGHRRDGCGHQDRHHQPAEKLFPVHALLSGTTCFVAPA